MKVLITGGTGFLGGRCAERMLSLGMDVHVLGRNQFIGSNLEKIGIGFHQGDLSDGEAVLRSIKGADVVIHCGALSSPWGKYSDFYSSNVIGTENVISAVKKSNVKRLIHISTPSIYVNKQDQLGVSEYDPIPEVAINAYAETKRMAETRVDAAFSEGLPVITLRPQGIFGPGDTAIMPRLIRVAKRGALPVIGDGKNLIDLTYVDNVVDAIILCLDSPSKTLGKKYNITNGEPVLLYDALRKIFSELNIKYKTKKISFQKAYRIAMAMEWFHRTILTSKEPLLTRYSVCALGRSRTLNIEAAKRDLGYIPCVSMQDGILKFVEAWKKGEGREG